MQASFDHVHAESPIDAIDYTINAEYAKSEGKSGRWKPLEADYEVDSE